MARFKAQYPDYAFGRGSYGMPQVHDWKEGSTLSIGAYCSIAEGVQIFSVATIVPIGSPRSRFR